MISSTTVQNHCSHEMIQTNRLNALSYSPVNHDMYTLDASGGIDGAARLVRIG
jgi:hypothetical protein